jgi:3-oxoacyl-[acyl-carrier protein] reductase
MDPVVNDQPASWSRPVAIITGGGTGIGAATALLLAARGYSLVVNYNRSEEQAVSVKTACEALGAQVSLAQGDVSDDQACRAIVRAAIERQGRIDALVNNAGVTVYSGRDDWDALDAEAFKRVYEVNTIGAFQMVRAAAPYLRQRKGAIVNVSSAAGVLGRGSSVPYTLSKAALNALTLYLARTLAPDVRVNAVCPALVTSDWFKKGLGEEAYLNIQDAFTSSSPLRKPNTPQDVAEAVVWFIEKGATVTGELLLMDSGLHLT